MSGQVSRVLGPELSRVAPNWGATESANLGPFDNRGLRIAEPVKPRVTADCGTEGAIELIAFAGRRQQIDLSIGFKA